MFILNSSSELCKNCGCHPHVESAVSLLNIAAGRLISAGDLGVDLVRLVPDWLRVRTAPDPLFNFGFDDFVPLWNEDPNGVEFMGRWRCAYEGDPESDSWPQGASYNRESVRVFDVMVGLRRKEVLAVLGDTDGDELLKQKLSSSLVELHRIVVDSAQDLAPLVA